MPVTTFANEEVILKRNSEYLVRVDNPRKPGTRMFVTVNKNGHTDYPIRYCDGRVVYDRPEAFTQAFRRMARAAINRLL